MSTTVYEFHVQSKPKLSEDDLGPFVAFKLYYPTNEPDVSKRLQYGAWVTPETTPEEIDKLLLDFAKVALWPYIKQEMERTFG